MDRSATAALLAAALLALSLPPLRAQDPAAPQVAAESTGAAAMAAAEAAIGEGNAESVERGLTLLGRAADLFVGEGDSGAAAGALLALAGELTKRGDPREALALFDRITPLTAASGDPALRARAMVYLGAVHSQLDDQRRALAAFESALPLIAAAGDRRLELLTRNNLGAAYERLGETDKALASYRRALDLAHELGHGPGEVTVRNNLGTVYFTLGDLEAALAQWRRVVEIRHEMGDQAGEARALSHIGDALADRGEARAALDSYRKALPLLVASGDRRGEADTRTSLGAVYAALGEPDRALEEHRRALELARAVEARRIEGFALAAMGAVREAQGDRPAALALQRQALAVRREIGNRGDQADSLARLAHLERAGGDLAAARADVEEALEIVESQRTKVAREDLRLSYFAAKRDYYDLYVGVLMDLHRADPAGDWADLALAAAERARARSLLDLLGEELAGLREGVDPDLLDAEREAARRLDAAERRRETLLAGAHDEAEAARAEDEVGTLLARYREVRAELRTRSPRYAALTQPETLDAAAIRRDLLDADTVLLEYFLGRDRGVLWAVTRDGLTAHELPARATIDEAARAVLDRLTARNDPELGTPGESPVARRLRVERADAGLPAAAAALARIVLAPAANEIRGRRLAVVADGILRYVPFAVLPDPDDGGENPPPLIAGHEIVNLPSASTLAVLRGEAAGRPPASHLLAVVADPVFSTDDPRLARAGAAGSAAAAPPEVRRDIFRRLPFSRLEAEGIAALAPPEEVMTALDFAASSPTVTGGDLAAYRYLHFATHAVLDDEHPELSGLALSTVDAAGRAQDGFLRLHDVYNLHLDAELVTLSACETALGREVRGEGLVGLTRGFLYAGSERVVASLWSVQDRATAELMRRFYRGMLAEGRSPAAALRAAQTSLSTDPRWRSPYFWAPFVLVGEWK